MQVSDFAFEFGQKHLCLTEDKITAIVTNCNDFMQTFGSLQAASFFAEGSMKIDGIKRKNTLLAAIEAWERYTAEANATGNHLPEADGIRAKLNEILNQYPA
jgi:hypothetical protein